MSESLARRLADYAAGGTVPFHMPGHKRRALHSPGLPWELDITEIHGFDDLQDPAGVLLDVMKLAARLWGSERAFLLVNGSTGGILAGLHAVLPRGATLLMARNCHKAAYHAVELLGLEPVFLQPPVDACTGVAGSLAVEVVAQALEAHPQAKGLLLTSPTYDGVLSDVGGLCELCHSRGIPVLVDEAHGAHLGFSPFPRGAVAAGADLVVQSLHKTLPSLTQTALLHVQGGLVDGEKVARSLGMFQTSSPSYPLMASVDGCLRLIRDDPAVFERWFGLLDRFDRGAAGLRRLEVLCHGRDSLGNHPDFWGFDPSKLVICCRGGGVTGPRLMERLRREYGLELEMAAPAYATAMTGAGESQESLEALLGALLEVDASLAARAAEAGFRTPAVPERVLGPAGALERAWVALPVGEAVGRVAAQYLWAYPPGIPLLVPGERVPAGFPELLESYLDAGVALKSPAPAGAVRVCAL